MLLFEHYCKNVLGGFRGTGIHPFLPTKVLRRIAASQPSRPATPPNPSKPFNKTVLTESLTDFNAVQEANISLNALLDSWDLHPSPAKQYVRHSTKSIMRLHTRNPILEKDNADQKAVLEGRKRQLSGKRRGY